MSGKAWTEGYWSGFSNAMRRMSDEPDAPTTPCPYSEGWVPFGTHIDCQGEREFSDAVDDGGLPLFERMLPPSDVTEGDLAPFVPLSRTADAEAVARRILAAFHVTRRAER